MPKTATKMVFCDLAHGDLHGLLLGELQVAAGLVVAEGNRATHHGDLHHTALHLGHVGRLHRIIRRTEVDGLVDESLATGAGAHGLIVHLGATGFGQFSEPTLINLGGEGSTGTVETIGSGRGNTGSKSEHGGKQKSLLGEAHGKP